MSVKKLPATVAQVLHIPSLIILIGIAVFLISLIFFLFYEILIRSFEHKITFEQALEEIFQILLYIEIIAAIKIYFQKKYHFPLRFFVYIGITDVTRKLILEVENPQKVLMYAIGVLILIIALGTLEYKNKLLSQKERENDGKDFEL